MFLATAIRNNFVSLAEAQNTYKQNVVLVNTLVTSVLTSSLPTLNQNPPDWQDFITAYTEANGDALNWVNNVMARLLNVPDEVQNYNDIISQILQDAKTQASTLINQPTDQTALNILHNDLANLSTQMNLVVTFISGSVTNIQSFKDKLPDMANKLQSIADKATADANVDQQQIDKLNQDIANLQEDIKSLTAAIVALGIADAAALTLGVVATIAAWPVGALTWFVLAPAVALSTTYIALDAIKIKNDKATIESDQTQITGLTADVATLHVLAKNYASMSTQAQELEGNLQAILSEWTTLEADINAAITTIRTALSDASAENFNAVLNDINHAITEWNAGYAQAGALHLDLQVNNAQLQIGMTSTDVQAALNNGQTLSIIDYYNRLAA
jgi:chromosome segregation ATPase